MCVGPTSNGFIQKPSNTIAQCVAGMNGASVSTQRGLQDSECFRDLLFVDTTVSKGYKNPSLTVSFGACNWVYVYNTLYSFYWQDLNPYILFIYCSVLHTGGGISGGSKVHAYSLDRPQDRDGPDHTWGIRIQWNNTRWLQAG